MSIARRTSVTGLAISLVLTAGAQAQKHVLHVNAGFAGNNPPSNSVPVTAVHDLNADNKFDATGPELFKFMKKNISTTNRNGGFFEDETHVIENGGISHYWADGGDGYILRGVDRNLNGVIDDNEIAPFYRWGTGAAFSPETVTAGRVGGKVVLYAGLDSTARGIWRLEDKNNDGDALDAGETVNLNVAGKSFTGKSGMVTLSNNEWERVRYAELTKQIIAYNQQRTKRDASNSTVPDARDDTGVHYAFEETNGTLTKHGVFMNVSKINKLPENADIASGALADMDIAMTINNVQYQYNDFLFYEIDPTGHLNRFPVHYFANTYGPKRSFGSKNLAGVALHGIILRGIDLNRDGDLQDKGEVNVFFNGSGVDFVKGGSVGTVKKTTWDESLGGRGNVSSIAQFFSGLAYAGDTLYAFVENGQNDYVLALEDKNNNGVIDPSGEVTHVHETPSSHNPPLYNSSFGLFSLELHAIDRNLMVDPLPKGIVPIAGRLGCPTSSGLAPAMSARGGDAQTGNLKLQIEMKRGEARRPAILWLGLSKDKLLGTINLPFALDVVGFKGCSQHVSTEFLFPNLTNTGGGAAWPLPLPADNNLKNLKLYMQTWNQDPSANSGGWVTSNAIELTIQ